MAKKPKKLDEISKKFGAEREKALNDALKLIEKDFGKGSIMRLGERAEQKVQLHKRKKRVVLQPLSMRSMPSIQLMLRPLVSTLTNCSCHNQTQESKVLRLQEN